MRRLGRAGASRAATAAALGLVAACGARSSLFGGSGAAVGSGGAGASTSATSSSSDGSGGGGASTMTSASGGGGALPCTLAVTGADVQAPASSAYATVRPALVSLAPATPPVALVVRLDPLEGPGPERSLVAVSGLDPWGAWPPAIPLPLELASTSLFAPFVAAPSGAGLFGLLVDAEPPNDESGGLEFTDDANVAGVANFEPWTLTHDQAAFLDVRLQQAGPAVLGRWVPDATGGAHLSVEAFAEAGEKYACGMLPLPAAAARVGDALIVALASQGTATDCLGDPPPTIATWLGVRRIRPGAPDWNVDGSYFILGARVLDVQVVARTNGAWVAVVAGASPTAGGQPTLIAVDANGLAGNVETILTNLASNALGAAPFGEGLFLVTLDATTSALEAHLFNAFAKDLGSVAIPFSSPERATGPLAVVGSPSGRAWLVAWSAEPLTGSDSAPQVHLARIGCAEDGAP